MTGSGRSIGTAATQLWSGTYAVRIFLVNTSGSERLYMRLNGTASSSDWDLYCDNATGIAPRYTINQVVDYNIITHTRYNGVISSMDLPKGTSLSVVTGTLTATIYYAIYKIV